MSDFDFTEEDWTGIVAPDLSIAEAFWNELSPGHPEIRIRFLRPRVPTLTDKRRSEGREREYPSLRDGWSDICDMQADGWNVFYFPNEIYINERGRQFARNEDVNRIRALFVDFDHGLPDDFSWHVQPNLVVKTSVVNGVQKGQALWLTNLPSRSGIYDNVYAYIFRGNEQRLLTAYTEYQPDGNVVNAARILRLPGSLHLKDPTRRQLVTFEVVHDDGTPKPGYALTSHRRPLDVILAGIPPLPPKPEKNSSAAKGEPANLDRLMECLSWLDPEMPNDQWRDVIWALANTTVAPTVPAAYLGSSILETDMLDIALRWSRGELYRDPEKYRGAPPDAYFGSSGTGGDDDVEELFNRAGDQIGYGTIEWMARVAGMPSKKEQLAPPADDGLPSWVPRDVLRSGRHYAMLPRYYKDAPEFKFFDDDKVLPNNPDGAVALLYANFSNHKTNWATAVSIDLIQKKGLLIVYAAGEGDIDVGKLRVPAIAAKAHEKTVNDFDDFVIVPSVPNLAIDPEFSKTQPNARDRAAFSELLREVERKHGRKIDIIWIDTLATATVGVEENSSEFGGLLTKSGPVGMLAKEFKALVIVIHHTGKDEARGARGSNALNCNIDALYECKYDHGHELLYLFVEKTKTTRPRFSTYYKLESGGWPVPIQISRDVFEALGGTDTDDKHAKKQKEKQQDSKAKELREWLRTQVEKYPTWSKGVTDAEAADLYLETHGDPEPKDGDGDEYKEWATRKRRLSITFTDAHHKPDAEPGVAKFIGDWRTEKEKGKKETWQWRWFNNGYADPVAF